MGLILLHPEVAFRDCEVCKKYLFNENTGEIERHHVTDEIEERPKGTFPPCHENPKGCPKVSPEAGLGLTEQNLLAYKHYRECRAVGQFPDDPIVRENAVIISDLEQQRAKREQWEFLQSFVNASRG